MKDMDSADVILGIRIKRENDKLILTQSHYIEKILKKFYQYDSTTMSTPFDPHFKLYPNTGRVVDQLLYSRVVGSLMYAMTCTRPDIAFVVGKVSRYTSNPSSVHWHAINQVLKYLRKTIDYGIVYTGYPSVLEGYTNVSWIIDSEVILLLVVGSLHLEVVQSPRDQRSRCASQIQPWLPNLWHWLQAAKR